VDQDKDPNVQYIAHNGDIPLSIFPRHLGEWQAENQCKKTRFKKWREAIILII
jgi:hypothetical protein